jgi:uncharacterized protein
MPSTLDRLVRDIVARIVLVARPEKIVLFGSATRGYLGPNSDLDFLVVVAGPIHRRRLAQSIYRNLIGIGYPADIIVVSTEDVVRHRLNPNLVIRSALDKGQIVYAA